MRPRPPPERDLYRLSPIITNDGRWKRSSPAAPLARIRPVARMPCFGAVRRNRPASSIFLRLFQAASPAQCCTRCEHKDAGTASGGPPGGCRPVRLLRNSGQAGTPAHKTAMLSYSAIGNCQRTPFDARSCRARERTGRAISSPCPVGMDAGWGQTCARPRPGRKRGRGRGGAAALFQRAGQAAFASLPTMRTMSAMMSVSWKSFGV